MTAARGEDHTLAPHGFTLASTIEKFSMPLDVAATVRDKSTWARRGVAVQNTFLEPGWTGFLTLELSNHGTETVQIARGMPICQIIFELLDQPTDQSYAGGKYDNQPARPVPAILVEDGEKVSLPAFITGKAP